MTDEQPVCLACGEPVGHAGRVCDECLWDMREDDHEEPRPKEEQG